LLLVLALASCGGGGGGGASAPPTFTMGGTLSGLVANEQVTLANNGGDALIVSTNGAFTFNTPLAQNSGYAVTVSAQPPGEMCSISAGSGSAVTANVATVVVTCQELPQYAYVVNSGDNSVSQFSISGSGELIPLSAPTVATGNAPQSVTVNSTLRAVYVTSLYDKTVSQYAIQADGTLVPMTPATVQAGYGSTSLGINATGDTAMVANSYDGTVSTYEIQPSGALFYLGTGLIGNSASSYPQDIVFNSAAMLYVVYEQDFTVGQYKQNAEANAQFQWLGYVPTGPAPVAIALDTRLNYAYVANRGDGSISQYDSSAGTLRPLNPAFAYGGGLPDSIAIDSSNSYVYISNAQSGAPDVGAVYQYTISTTGQLVPMATPFVYTGSGPAWITLDPFRRYAYVANSIDGTISEYTIGPDGALLALGTVPAGNSPLSIATTY
jgi:6-phosphogluconolactonase